MPDSTSRLGACPFCGATIHDRAILVKYEVEGTTKVFAECPDCKEPVKPE